MLDKLVDISYASCNVLELDRPFMSRDFQSHVKDFLIQKLYHMTATPVILTHALENPGEQSFRCVCLWPNSGGIL